MKCPSVAGIVLLTACLAAPPALAVAISDSFDTDANGWLIVSYPFRSHVPSPIMQGVYHDDLFGNPPGSIEVGDVYGETGVAAPAPYLGDKSGFYGGSLHYDIYIRYTDNITYPAVVLNGGTISLYYDTASPPLNEWESRVIPLAEAGWRVSGSGFDATEQQFRDVLADLHGLYFYTEWRTGPDDTHFDNPVMTDNGTPVGDGPARRNAVVAHHCRPNPFNPATEIGFELASEAAVRLGVYDLTGRLVVSLVMGERLPAGPHRIAWRGVDDGGRVLGSGVYIYRLQAGDDLVAGRMTLVR
ncbi:hypothetical protein H8E07_09505 [bacterium]|nr:hypothetical protein [bacterium]